MRIVHRLMLKIIYTYKVFAYTCICAYTYMCIYYFKKSHRQKYPFENIKLNILKMPTY